MRFGPPGHFRIQFYYAKVCPYCFIEWTLLHCVVLLCVSVPPRTLSHGGGGGGTERNITTALRDFYTLFSLTLLGGIVWNSTAFLTP